jgi:hypothetical protein
VPIPASVAAKYEEPVYPVVSPAAGFCHGSDCGKPCSVKSMMPFWALVVLGYALSEACLLFISYTNASWNGLFSIVSIILYLITLFSVERFV